MIPRIKGIVKVELYKIVCNWSTDELRIVDFTDWYNEAQNKKDSLLYKLFTPEVFVTVHYDKEQNNIVWPHLLPMKDYNGNTELVDLDFSPEVLYNISTVANNTQLK